MGKSHVSAVKPLFDLLTFPLSQSVNYHIKTSNVSWAVIVGQWCVAGLSVLAHTHTAPVDSFTLMWVGREGTTPFLFFHLFYSSRELGESFSGIHDFPVYVPFMFWVVVGSHL